MIEISMETVAPGGLDVEGAIGRAGQFALEQEGQGDAWLSVQVCPILDYLIVICLIFGNV